MDVYVAFPKAEKLSFAKTSFAENEIFQTYRLW
jgi:hypothetical protein